MPEKNSINISTSIIFKTVLIILAMWFLYLVKDVIAILFVAIIFASSIEPVVNWLEIKKIPRSLGILIVYFSLFLIFGTMIYFLIPPFIVQFKSFTEDFPSYVEKTKGIFKGFENYAQSHNFDFKLENFFANIGGNLAKSSGRIFSTTIGVFSGFISVIVILSLTFYMSIKKDGIKNSINSMLPEKYHNYASKIVDQVKVKIGKWMQGQFMLMIVIFAFYFLLLYFLDIPYALLLAIFGGVLEIIPYLGPIISAIPPVIIGFLISPVTGFLVLGGYVIIQQIENHVLTPQIMKKAVGLNPVVIILVLLIGAKMAGVLGAILAVPVATVASVILKDVFNRNTV